MRSIHWYVKHNSPQHNIFKQHLLVFFEQVLFAVIMVLSAYFHRSVLAIHSTKAGTAI
jgi:hypothetical protein